MSDAPSKVLIWSGEHCLFWRANASGYTAKVEDAGRYDLEEARAYLKSAGPEKRLSLIDATPARTVPYKDLLGCITETFRQLEASDQYARDAAHDAVPTVWEIQNLHVRGRLNEMFKLLGAKQ